MQILTISLQKMVEKHEFISYDELILRDLVYDFIHRLMKRANTLAFQSKNEGSFQLKMIDQNMMLSLDQKGFLRHFITEEKVAFHYILFPYHYAKKNQIQRKKSRR